MNKTVWLIRAQDGHGWSDYPAIYGDTWTSEEACRTFAAKLAAERKDRHVAVYQCTMVEEHWNR